jgi:hypothetical protein
VASRRRSWPEKEAGPEGRDLSCGSDAVLPAV